MQGRCSGYLSARAARLAAAAVRELRSPRREPEVSAGDPTHPPRRGGGGGGGRCSRSASAPARRAGRVRRGRGREQRGTEREREREREREGERWGRGMREAKMGEKRQRYVGERAEKGDEKEQSVR